MVHISKATGLKFRSLPFDRNNIADLRFGIIFDAGSTGSRVHIYRFRMVNSVPVLEDEIFVEVKPGLSAYVPEGVGADSSTRDVGQSVKGSLPSTGPDAAAESLRKLMDLCVEEIPRELHARTPISLRATAGLRLLGDKVAESILGSIRTLFATYPFPHDPRTDVEVMGGSEEGVFAWITVNYLTRHLSDSPIPPNSNERDHPRTSAVLDLGGASTQIVFEPATSSLDALPKEDFDALYTLPYGARQYKLFETSYLGYGLMEARRRTKLALHSHPLMEIRPLDSLAPSADGSLYHPCLADNHSEQFLIDAHGQTVTLRGHAAGYASCGDLVRTLFPKHPRSPCQRSSCSFGGHFALPLAQHAFGDKTKTKSVTPDHPIPDAHAALTDGQRGKIYAFSYFYDRTLEIFELEEESDSEPDGTVLRLSRLHELADTICSFSMRSTNLRTEREIAAERMAAWQRHMERLRTRGCKIAKVRNSETNELEEVRLEETTSEATGDDKDDGECMVEDTPNWSTQSKRSKISSTFVSLLSENPYLCLDLTYAYTLLHYGYDLPDSTELHIMKRIDKKEVGWCLGAMLSQMGQRGW